MARGRVIIKADLCKGCRVCVESCPAKCLAIGAEINAIGYQHVEFVAEQCRTCGICYYVCPEPGALTVVREDEPAPDKPEPAGNAEEES